MPASPTHFRPTVLLGLLVLLPGAASADWQLYGGLGAGFAAVEVDLEPFTPVNVPQLTVDRELEGSSLAFQGFAGLRYGKYVAVEAGYFRYDGFKDTTFFATPDPVVPPFLPTATYETEVDGYTLSLVGFWPLSQELEVFGKVGTVSWDTEFDIDSADVHLSEKTDGTDPMFGLGLDYRATGPLRLRLELQYLDIDELNYNVTASAIYSFTFGR